MSVAKLLRAPFDHSHRSPRQLAILALALVPWLLLFSWLVQLAWFLCDDAFISFRYVRNLANGHGLVFNIGERVEGYSNFLWVIELALLWATTGMRPETASLVLSVLCTCACFAPVIADALRSNAGNRGTLTAWMAAGLLASSASFAAWTSSGLETRQFTLLILFGVYLSAPSSTSHGRPVLASLCFGAAALTRPEGVMFGLLALGFESARDWIHRDLDRKRLLRRALPFGALVVGQLAFRYFYYGDLLPNTYYAKHVRPWYESGFRYLVDGALETGLYLWVPLAFIGARERLKQQGDSRWMLALMMIAAHAYYLMRVGGDHFEFRMMDFYFPLLAVPAVEGMWRVAHGVVELIGLGAPSLQRHRVGSATALWGLLFLVTVLYSSAIQAQVLLLNSSKLTYAEAHGLQLDLDEGNSRLLMRLPGMDMLVALSNEARRTCIEHLVAMRIAEHKAFCADRLKGFSRYEGTLAATLIPSDATMEIGTVGVAPFYLPTLRIIDTLGLVDRTVARNPVERPNAVRQLAHDRRPPPGYLQQRRTGFRVYGATSSPKMALKHASYAIPVADHVWMPFDAPDHDWAQRHFVNKGLVYRQRFSNRSAQENEIRVLGKTYRGYRLLTTFENSNEGWTLEGNASQRFDPSTIYRGQQPAMGHVGEHFLTTYHPKLGDKATGRASSPAFRMARGEVLGLLIAGGSQSAVEVRLLANGHSLRRWSGQNSETFRLVTWTPPTNLDLANTDLQLEVVDEATDAWGHLMLDHVVLYEPKAVINASLMK